MSGSIKVRDPRAEASGTREFNLPTISGLSGKTLAILSNGWESMGRIAPQLVEELMTHYDIGQVLNFTIPLMTSADSALLDSVAKRADFVVVGLGN